MIRVNKAIDLLERSQPIYYVGPEYFGFEGGYREISYAEGVRLAQTWADAVIVLMEQDPLDIARLRDFMRGMVDGGPTSSGHRTPTVLVELPMPGRDEAVILANSWIVNQVMATGVHGMVLCHADNAEAVRAFVTISRYPFYTIDGTDLPEGKRGGGGNFSAAPVWGLTSTEYLRRADIWPLNRDGEILLGVKIENRHGLSRTEEILAVPGVSYAEWAPFDMSLSFGELDAILPPYSDVVRASRERVLASCRDIGLAYVDEVDEETVIDHIDGGLMICVPLSQRVADIGRRHTQRPMPW